MIHQSTESQQTQAFANDYESVLPDHYRLIEMVGRGGMAEVFVAEDKRLGRKVAIKFLNSEFRRDPDRMRRFRQEAKAASALNHQNILTIHDIGENSGVQYLVSEFVEGQTLGARIGRGRLALSEAVDIALQVASALSASHNAGIVHRDIKPDNVMIRNDGVVKVLDFGLAKTRGFNTASGIDFDAMTLDSGSTSPGLIVGTPQYMSPEQARGKELDGRTDIFSLGSVLFEMVTRRSPFAGESFADTMAGILTKEPKRLEEYIDNPPVRLIDLISNALKKNRDERFATMGEMVFELRQLQSELSADPARSIESPVFDTERTEIRPTDQLSLSQHLSNGLRKHPTAGLIGVLSLVIVLGLIWMYFPRSSQTGPANVLRSVPITSWSSGVGELSSSASFSPNVEMIAFAANRSGASEIFVKPRSAGDPVQVTKNGYHNQYPIWSPNGQDIAFFSRRDGRDGIWRAAFTGGQETKILSTEGLVRPVLWGKDGKIYFERGPELFVVNVATGESERASNFEASGESPRAIRISGDGSRLAYVVFANGRWMVKVRERNSVEGHVVADSEYQIDHIAWDPKSDSVVFSKLVDGVYQVFEASPGTAPIQLSNGNQDVFVHDVSSDASNILYGTIVETSDIWRLNTLDGSLSPVSNEVAAEYWPDVGSGAIAFQSVTQTERPTSGSVIVKDTGGNAIVIARSSFSPAWSPDGRWIAYFSRTETGIELWRASPTGNDAVRLAGINVWPPGYSTSPYLKIGTNHIGWSPDSSKIAFESRSTGASNISTVDVDGSNLVQLTDNADSNETYCCPMWTRDGTAILTTVAGVNGSRVVLREIEKHERRSVFDSRERVRVLGFSSDGGSAFVAQRVRPVDLAAATTTVEIFLVRLSDGQKSPVTSVANIYLNNIHLSRDGEWIAFTTQLGGVTSLRRIPSHGGASQELVVENDPKIMISSLSWSPDSRAIVFGKQTRTHMLSLLSAQD